MKAIVYDKYGPPDVLSIEDVEKPSPGSNELLVKVYAATVNRTDYGFLRAKPFFVRFFSGLFRPKRKILGNEFAGEIEAVGEKVTKFRIGDRVFGFSGDSFGALAQYMTVSQDGPVATIPGKMRFAEIVPSTEGAHYALTSLRAARIGEAVSILIYGATGAIGTAAVQLAKYFGAEVTAVSNTKNVRLVKDLGADEVIDYQKTDFTQTDKKFDFVFDAVGKTSFFDCKELIKSGGLFMATDLGPYWQNVFLPMWTSIFGDKRVLFPLPKESQEDVKFLKALVEEDHFKPVIDRSYPLERTVEAFKYVETEQKTGNVVIKIYHDSESKEE